MDRLTAILIGFALDLLLGDPHWKYHPIRLIGSLIANIERILRSGFPKAVDKQERAEFTAGVIEVFVVVIIATVLPLGLLFLAYRIHPAVGIIVESICCYFVLALKSLRDESMKVYKCLEQDDLEQARAVVSMIVGRDTQNLSKEGITKAAVETVAENVSDGVIAPLLYLFLFGAAGGFFYKAVNTMDSMLGYRNETYQYFGRFAAKMDDVLNFLPSRIAGLLMVVAAGLTGLDQKGAFRIFKRDRRKHASPNSAHTEAACAGALQIQLAGDAYYFGKLHHKETIGDAQKEITPYAIIEANRLSYATGILGLIVFSVITGLFFYIPFTGF
ncbi:MAG: cobalamin biosynthesis protein CobD [Clostridia bacterium]|nr:cobalamin biosynthesis protein CobD [Clostridia bacterium]